MGISPDPPSDCSKGDVAMGYPPAAPPRPQGCMPSSSPYQQYHSTCAPSPCPYPHGYPSASAPASPLPHSGYEASQFQHHGYSQPYNDYYYQRQYYKAQESRNSTAFGRMMLILMIVLIAGMCMMSVVMWILFGTYIPEFEVKSIKLSNFTTTNTTLTGIWNVGISISNFNKELLINFDHGISSIFYKEAALGISTLKPFNVEKNQEFNLNFSMAAVQTSDDSKLLPTLAEDRSNGAVVLSLRMAMEANFTAKNVVHRRESLRVLCEDMQISFSRATGEGTLSPGLVNDCFVRLHEDFI